MYWFVCDKACISGKAEGWILGTSILRDCGLRALGRSDVGSLIPVWADGFLWAVLGFNRVSFVKALFCPTGRFIWYEREVLRGFILMFSRIWVPGGMFSFPLPLPGISKVNPLCWGGFRFCRRGAFWVGADNIDFWCRITRASGAVAIAYAEVFGRDFSRVFLVGLKGVMG